MSTELTSYLENNVIDVFSQVSGLSQPEDWLVESLVGSKSSSGAKVNVSTALGYPPLWAAVSKISGHIGQMEIEQIKQTTDKPRVTNHAAYQTLNRTPNEFQTPQMFRQQMQLHALLYGNGRAWIERNGQGRPIAMYPLPPETTQTLMSDGEKVHTTFVNQYDIASSEERSGKTYVIPDRDVFHVVGLSYNGVWGVPLLTVARDAVGLGLAGQDATGSQFRNSGRPGLLLEVPKGQLRNEKDASEFLQAFKKEHQGVDAAGKIGLIREGMRAHVMPISAADAQFLEQRKFQREDMALLFFNELLGDKSSAYKSLSEKNTAYINNCLSRWLYSWTQEASAKLITPAEQSSDLYRFKFDTSKLLAGDPNTLADYTGKLRAQGLINGDEARDMHGLPPAGLDNYDNPNITTEKAVESTEDDDDDEADNEIRNAALRSIFRGLIEYECKKLNSAAKGDGTFLNWCDTFYTKQQALMELRCEEVKIPKSLAVEHCETSKQALLELTGCVSPDALPSAVGSMVADWPEKLSKRFLDV